MVPTRDRMGPVRNENFIESCAGAMCGPNVWDPCDGVPVESCDLFDQKISVHLYQVVHGNESYGC